MSKLCCKCRIVKTPDNFFKDHRMKMGLSSQCRDCKKEYYNSRGDKNRAYRKLYRKLHPEVARKRQLKYNYGLSIEDYQNLLFIQNFSCKICLEKRPLQVDHNHKTGQVRGLLCGQCNRDLAVIEKYFNIQIFLDYLNEENNVENHPRLCKTASDFVA